MRDVDDLLLNVSDLGVRRGGEPVVDEVDFSLKSGDVMGLVGKSGAGKSTVMEAMLGVIENSGTVWLRDGSESLSLKKFSGYSTQEGSLYPLLTLEENLNLFDSLRSTSADSFEERKKRLLKDLNIYQNRHQRISDFSGGMRKRADLATALIHNPLVLMMDEPLAGIDPPQRSLIWSRIESFVDSGRIVILTSHMIDEMVSRCNKFGLVHDASFFRAEEVDQMMDDTGYQSVERFLNDAFSI